MKELEKISDRIRERARECRKEAFLEIAERNAEEGRFSVDEKEVPAFSTLTFADLEIDESEVIATLATYRTGYEAIDAIDERKAALRAAIDKAMPDSAGLRLMDDPYGPERDFAAIVASVLVAGPSPWDCGYDVEGGRVPSTQAIHAAIIELIAENAAEIMKREGEAVRFGRATQEELEREQWAAAEVAADRAAHGDPSA